MSGTESNGGNHIFSSDHSGNAGHGSLKEGSSMGVFSQERMTVNNSGSNILIERKAKKMATNKNF